MKVLFDLPPKLPLKWASDYEVRRRSPYRLIAPSRLVQFHWMNPEHPSETLFVEQVYLIDEDTLCEWWNAMMQKHIENKPPGWEGMVCGSTSKFFKVLHAEGEMPEGPKE